MLRIWLSSWVPMITDSRGRSRRMQRPASAAFQPKPFPRDQAYYWTARWQAGIEHSRAALARGDFREFDNGRDLARWLLSDDD